MKTPPSPLLGQPVSRVDGPLKVTGQAKYAGEVNVPGLTYGQVASSTIARGRIQKLDITADARAKGRTAEDAARLVGWSRATLYRHQQAARARAAVTEQV